jgi:hypothetical protein
MQHRRAIHLNQPYFDSSFVSLVDLLGRMQCEQSTRLNFASGIENKLLNLLVFSQRFTEGNAFVCSITHQVKRALGLPEPSHAVKNSTGAETILGDFESVSPCTEQILFRNPNVVVNDLVVAVKFTHHCDIANDVVSVSIGGDDDHGERGMRRRIVWLRTNHGGGISRGPRP